MIRPRNLFLVIVIITLLLILLCIIIDKQGAIFIDKKINIDNRPTPIPVQRPTAIAKTIKVDLSQINKRIKDTLLKNPISFLENSYELDNSGKMGLDRVISILKEINSNIAIEIASYSDINGSNSYNRELSQRLSDKILEYISKRHSVRFIYAIGYGREFFLKKESNRTITTPVEIKIKRIRDDF